MQVTPRERVLAECQTRGQAAVVSACVDLYRTGTADPRLLSVLGGPSAHHPVTDVWPRVWALRGLLWSWQDGPAARTVLADACVDEAWRCREMALKVVARHRVDALLDEALTARHDRVARVRAAAERAVVRLTAPR